MCSSSHTPGRIRIQTELLHRTVQEATISESTSCSTVIHQRRQYCINSQNPIPQYIIIHYVYTMYNIINIQWIFLVMLFVMVWVSGWFFTTVSSFSIVIWITVWWYRVVSSLFVLRFLFAFPFCFAVVTRIITFRSGAMPSVLFALLFTSVIPVFLMLSFFMPIL